MKKLSISMKRRLVQFLSALAINLNLPGFINGNIYTGQLKGICVPVLNCYSCPGALGACPIGALQSSFAARGGKVAYYVLGSMLLFALTLGRFFCGWLCPFGALQGLLHKIPVKKAKIPNSVDRPMRYLKYVMLFVMVIALPLLVRNGVDMSQPFFCKWICPAGTLEGGVPLAIANGAVRSALGGQFLWKMSVAVLILIACVFIYRAFCKYLCPLGAFYALFAKLSLYRFKVDAHACIGCGKCAAVCKMGVDPVKTPNSAECIRCGDCIGACPVNAIGRETPFCSRKNAEKENVE